MPYLHLLQFTIPTHVSLSGDRTQHLPNYIRTPYLLLHTYMSGCTSISPCMPRTFDSGSPPPSFENIACSPGPLTPALLSSCLFSSFILRASFLWFFLFTYIFENLRNEIVCEVRTHPLAHHRFSSTLSTIPRDPCFCHNFSYFLDDVSERRRQGPVARAFGPCVYLPVESRGRVLGMCKLFANTTMFVCILSILTDWRENQTLANQRRGSQNAHEQQCRDCKQFTHPYRVSRRVEHFWKQVAMIFVFTQIFLSLS